MNRDLAPIILFVYNRPWHTRQTLEALKLNELAKDSRLIIFSDGIKENSTKQEINKVKEVRSLIREEKWCGEVKVIERTENLGLAESIIQGVTEVIEKYGKVIVLEDDIVTSSGFLNYMNTALSFYSDKEKVMHISGYMYPNKDELPETFFFNVPLCWGWATWKRSWKHLNDNSQVLWDEIQSKELIPELDKFGGDYLSSQLAHNISGLLNTWFIKWHASVLLNGGFTLYPAISLVDNIGFDNTGVHNGETAIFKNETLARNISIQQIEIVENKDASKIIKEFYHQIVFPNSIIEQKNLTIKRRLKILIKNLFYRIFPELIAKPIYKENLLSYNRAYFGKHCKIYPKAVISESIVGSYTYIAQNSIINKTIIGKFCSIGPNLIAGWGLHPTNGISTHPMFYSTRKQNGITFSSTDKVDEIKPVKIGNDVFIGMNVTILDGVKIGDGAVIGAGAVVSKDIPPYAIAVGCPIRIIDYRFEENTIEKMLNLKWWELEEESLKLVEKHFFDISTFIAELEEKG